MVRIEQAKRAIRIDQFLVIAAALATAPTHLLAPAYGRSLTVGHHGLAASQVLVGSVRMWAP